MIGLDTNILARYYIQDKSDVDVIMRLHVGNGEPPPLYPGCRAEQHSQDGGSRWALSERSEFSPPPGLASSAGNSEGTRQGVPFSLVHFFWANKRNELARRSETDGFDFLDSGSSPE